MTHFSIRFTLRKAMNFPAKKYFFGQFDGIWIFENWNETFFCEFFLLCKTVKFVGKKKEWLKQRNPLSPSWKLHLHESILWSNAGIIQSYDVGYDVVKPCFLLILGYIKNEYRLLALSKWMLEPFKLIFDWQINTVDLVFNRVFCD